MTAPSTEPGQAAAFWHDLLADAHNSRPPRYLEPGRVAEGTDPAVHEATLPEGIAFQAAALDVPVRTLLLAVHVAVAGFLAGSRDVLTGYDGPGGMVPLRVPFEGERSWAAIVKATGAAESAIRPHLGHPPPMFRQGGEPVVDTAVRYMPGGWHDSHPPVPRVPLHAEFRDDGAGEFRLFLRYQPHLHPAEQVARFAGYYRAAFTQLMADPAGPFRGDGLLDEPERAMLLGFGGPEVRLPGGTFPDLFAEQVERHPDRIALTCGRERLTYAGLDAAAARAAAALRAEGVERGDVVTTMLPRGVPWAVTVLALLKLGACYLPQDLDYPAERVAAVLRRSGCRHLVAEPGAVEGLRASLAPYELPTTVFGHPRMAAGPGTPAAASAPGPDDLAYLIFTSGSTGEPKGAMIRHGGMLNHLLAKQADFGLGQDDRIAQVATQCFDISVWQLLNAWICGGSTVIYGRYDLLDVPGFLRALAADEVTVLEVVPSYLDLLLAEAAARPVELPRLRMCVVTGEPLPPGLTHRWFARYPHIPLVNAYGPTEASDDVTHHVLTEPVHGDRVPVGRAILNTGIHVLGPDGEPRPLGGYGEICVTGAGVGLGYVNDEERTVAAFRPNTLDDRSPTLYRTGDIGRWLPGGVLDCAGRRDDQVKVRGYRIELSDIDGALARLPGVDTAVTLARELDGELRLVTYYTGPAEPDLVAFQRGLATRLPAYMHPEKLVRLDTFPLTGNGKVDRAALARRALV